MELKYGDSSKYGRAPEADIMETTIFEGSYIERLANPQPQSLKNKIMADWILNAYGNGDPTAKFYNEGQPIFTPPHRYSKEIKNGNG
jgi:hypothetical protein